MGDGGVRDRILREATRLFACRGYGATSVRELVDAAGVTKPTLYYHFGNKDGLFVEAVAAQVAKLEAIVSGTLGGPGDPVQRLRDFVRAYVAAGRADQDGVRLMITIKHPGDGEPADGQPELDLLSVYRHTIGAIRDTVREGAEAGLLRADLLPESVALTILGACNLHIVAALHGLPLPPDVDLPLFDALLNGVISS